MTAEAVRLVLVEPSGGDEIRVEAELEQVVRVVDEDLAAAHPGAEVAPVRAEDDHSAARHVLARMVARPLDDRRRAGVPHAEALTRAPAHVERPAGRAVEHRVPDEDRIPRVVGRRLDDDPPAAHALADVVVRDALELEDDPVGQERAEALARRAGEARVHLPGRTREPEALTDVAAEARADGPVARPDRVRELDQAPLLERVR